MRGHGSTALVLVSRGQADSWTTSRRVMAQSTLSTLETGHTAMILECARVNATQTRTCYGCAHCGDSASQSWKSHMEIPE
jgi:hypothetical protein